LGTAVLLPPIAAHDPFWSSNRYNLITACQINWLP